MHAAVDTLGHVLALRVTAAREQDRAQVGALAADVQVATEESVELAYVDQGYTGAARWPPRRRTAQTGPGGEPWVGLLAAFAPARRCRPTVARSTCSSRAIRRWDQPWAVKPMIDCWMLTLIWFITPSAKAIFAAGVN